MTDHTIPLYVSVLILLGIGICVVGVVHQDKRMRYLYLTVGITLLFILL